MAQRLFKEVVSYSSRPRPQNKPAPAKHLFPEQDTIRRRVRHLIDTFRKSECAIRPHFFLTGPSGSGKSFLVSEICKTSEIPYFEINAAQLTTEGLSGNSLSKALRPLRQHWNEPSVIFVDEFDKLFLRNGEEAEHFRIGVQDEFLRVLEAENTSIFTDYGKYEPIKISNTLFIFAGAFSNQKIETIEDLKNAGLRNEFVGRVPLIFSTAAVDMDSMLEAIPHLQLLKDYLKIYPEVKPKKAIEEISEALIESSKSDQIIGIRLLNSLVHAYFMKDI